MSTTDSKGRQPQFLVHCIHHLAALHLSWILQLARMLTTTTCIEITQACPETLSNAILQQPTLQTYKANFCRSGNVGCWRKAFETIVRHLQDFDRYSVRFVLLAHTSTGLQTLAGTGH